MEGHCLSGNDRPGRPEIGVEGEKKKAQLGGCEMIIMDGQESALQGERAEAFNVTTVRKEKRPM